MAADTTSITTTIQEPSSTETPFYIPATGTATRPRRTLKHGDSFVVVDSHGDIGASPGGSDGLFHKDTRFLSHLELRVNGQELLLLGSNLRDDNTLLSVDLTNPDFLAEGRVLLQKDLLHIGRTMFLWRGTAYQRLAVRNHGDRPIELLLSIHFRNDFADLFEVRGMHRARRGSTRQEVIGPDRVLLSYLGLDEKLRSTTVAFEPAPSELRAEVAIYRLVIAAGEAQSLFVAIGCDTPRERQVTPFFIGLRTARREQQTATRGATTVVTSNEIFNEILHRSAADLQMLMTDTPEGRYPYAGTPWYSTTFGRDGLITALQMLWCDPRVARGVLHRLAAYQAKTVDPLADAQPGKILHEMRSGEMAALREVPFGLYYGSVDATPLFVLLAGLYGERTGDFDTVEALWPAIEAALGWIDGLGDPDQDGFVEYRRASELGLANQGWKIRTTRSSMPMAGWPKATSPSPRFRATSMPQKPPWPIARDDCAASAWRAASRPRPRSSPSASKRPSGVPRSALMPSPLTATRRPAAFEPRMPVICSSPGSCAPIAPPWWQPA